MSVELPDEGDEDRFVDDGLVPVARNQQWRSRSLSGNLPTATVDISRKQQLALEIAPDALIRLRRAARHTGRSQTAIVEQLIRTHL